MPRQVDIDGVMTTVYTQAEYDQALAEEVKGLKITNENLKAEKQEAKDKLSEAKEAERVALESAATAAGDKEALERLGAEREAEKQNQINTLMSSIKTEKTGGALNDLITKLGAGGAANEDLRDLIKSRYQFDYDMETHQTKVSGDGVATIAELEKAITSSGRYDAYLAGTKADGGGATGSKGSEGSGKKYADMTAGERSAYWQQSPEQAAIDSQKYEESK